MNFSELAITRYSSREYTDRPVTEDDIEAILEIGRLSPTAKNLQPVRVIVADTPESLAKISKAARLYGAPVGLIVVTDRSKAWVRPFDGKSFADIDASIVTTQMMYEAEELGLGTVWIGYFDPAVMKEEFGLSESEEVSAILAIGHRADETSRNHGIRKPISEFAGRPRFR